MQDYELDSLLEQYNVAVNSTRKTRGAILCDTDKGLLLLREVGIAQSRVPALVELYEYFAEQGYTDMDWPIRNKEEEYVTRLPDGTGYMLKHWVAGRECDIRRPAEILSAAGNLAKLHLLMQKELENQVPCASHLKDEYVRHNRELKKVRRYVRGVSPKGEFESMFLKYFDQMFEWADAAVASLENSDYDQLYANSIQSSHMAHGEYNYHNILVPQTMADHRMVTTNFERFKKDIQIEDLYYFLRKVMEKQGFKERLGDNMLNAYSAIKPISQSEMAYLKIRMIYPEKFWKIANSYYRSNKAWISVKNIEKMHTAVRQTREKELFLDKIFAFHL